MADVFCNKCGHRNPSTSNFCSSCGAQLDSVIEDDHPTVTLMVEKFFTIVWEYEER